MAASSSSLPDLSNLNVHDRGLRQPRRVLSDPENPPGDGVYCLDRRDATEPCGAYVILKRAAVKATPEAFAEAKAFFLNNYGYSNFMGHTVTRRQCTFGTVKYKNYDLVPPLRWPALVHRVIDATQAFAQEMGIDHWDEYDAVHGNYYEDEGAAVSPHADDEAQLVKGAPIFSYTFLEHDDNARARDFWIIAKPKQASIEGRGTLAKVRLESGDLLVMAGDMQERFNHALPKPPGAVEGGYAPRLNFTVRRFRPAESKKRAHGNA